MRAGPGGAEGVFSDLMDLMEWTSKGGGVQRIPPGWTARSLPPLVMDPLGHAGKEKKTGDLRSCRVPGPGQDQNSPGTPSRSEFRPPLPPRRAVINITTPG